MAVEYCALMMFVWWLVNCALATYVSMYTKQRLSAMSAASSVAEEVVTNIRTVIAFLNERNEGKRFSMCC
jgi:ABC-type multidrug transport system fused ATPase/permease subunit